MRNISLQQNSRRILEQIQLEDWRFIKPFLQDYFIHACKSGNAFNQDVGNMLSRKLPGALGDEITKRLNDSRDKDVSYTHISRILEEKYSDIQIKKQLKGLNTCTHLGQFKFLLQETLAVNAGTPYQISIDRSSSAGKGYAN